MRVERALADVDAETGSARRRYVAVLHNEIGLRYQRIGADDAEPEDEFAGRHDVIGRPARIEMRAGRGFELREYGKTTAIDLDVGGLRDRRDLARRRDAAVLVELDAEHVGGLCGDDRVGVLDRQTGFVGHQRHAGRRAADRRHSGEIVPLDRLLEIVDAVLLQCAQRLQRVGDGPSGVGVHAERHLGPDRLADRAKVARVLLPAVRMAGFHAEHLDAELVERALGVGHHGFRIGRHADRPFERNARLRQARRSNYRPAGSSPCRLRRRARYRPRRAPCSLPVPACRTARGCLRRRRCAGRSSARRRRA